MQKQDKAALQALVRDKANVNAPQADGATALHWAAHWDDLETADLLIAAGANVNAKNDYSATPLSLACTNGNAAMVEKLLAAGANPNRACHIRRDAVDALRAHGKRCCGQGSACEARRRWMRGTPSKARPL